MHLGSVPWLLEWRRHCENAAANALAYITSHGLVCQQQARGLASLRHQHATRVAQIESRLTRLTGVAKLVEQRELDDEQVLFARLNDAVRVPSVRTDVAGAIFASAGSPFVK
jgi:hypothetical protein